MQPLAEQVLKSSKNAIIYRELVGADYVRSKYQQNYKWPQIPLVGDFVTKIGTTKITLDGMTMRLPDNTSEVLKHVDGMVRFCHKTFNFAWDSAIDNEIW